MITSRRNKKTYKEIRRKKDEGRWKKEEIIKEANRRRG